MRGAGALVLATTVANAGNHFINLYLGRALGPAGFGEATLLATFVLPTSIVTTAIGFVLSRMAAVRPIALVVNSALLLATAAEAGLIAGRRPLAARVLA